MKKIRKISEEEREILIKERIRSKMPLGTLFYIMGILLPFFVCMLITGDFKYLHVFLIGFIILLFVTVIYPLIYYNHLQTGDLECFESIVLSCRKGDIYYYKVEIEGIDGDYLPIKYPVLKKCKIGSTIVVIMVAGKNAHRFLLIDKEKKCLLSSRRTRFDLID